MPPAIDSLNFKTSSVPEEESGMPCGRGSPHTSKYELCVTNIRCVSNMPVSVRQST
jgi:hypothetical protein